MSAQDEVVLDGELSLINQLDGDVSLNAQMDGEQGQYTRYNWRGYSAYEIAVLHGFVGSEEEWLISIKGDPGYSPVRGTDYWTTEDRNAIIEDILDHYPAAEEVSF